MSANKQNKYTVLNGALTLIDADEYPRATEDPIWLTNSLENTFFKDNDSIADIGSGIGTIALILALKHTNLNIMGYEVNDVLTKAAVQNAKLNNLDNCQFETRNMLNNPPSITFDHVVSNPPYHNMNKGFESKSKEQAHGATEEEMKTWIQTCLAITKAGGTCHFIHHMHNLDIIKPLLADYTFTTTSITTSIKRPPKRVIISVQK